MKRLCLCLLALALLLGGCGRSGEAERRERLAEELKAGRELRFTAALRAEYPDRTVSFRLAYEEDAEGCTLRVLEPEEISGLSLRLGPDGARLRFEELSLDAGPLDRYGLSPVSALPALAQALREGHLESAWREEGLTVWELASDGELRVRVRLDEALTPRSAELISEGRAAVYLEIEDWEQ